MPAGLWLIAVDFGDEM